MERKGAERQRGYCGEFVLIDLYSQYDAVYRYIDGWPIDDILAWIAQYGEIVIVQHYGLSVGNRQDFPTNPAEIYVFMPGCCPNMTSSFQVHGEKFHILQRRPHKYQHPHWWYEGPYAPRKRRT